MTRRRFRYDAQMDEIIEIRDSSNFFEEKGEAPSVISDDVGAGVNGLKHMPSGKMLDSKSAHYRETKARGLEHVGDATDFASKKAPLPKPDDYAREVKDAREQLQSNWNGTADLRRAEREGRA